jgi:hypothetical protein
MGLYDRLVDAVIERARQTPHSHLPGYMERYWLIHYRNPLGLALRVHHILRSDERDFHNHPWSYLTLILRGGYFEVTPERRDGAVVGERRRWYGPGSLLWRRAGWYHRLEIPPGQTAWTLFGTGRMRRHWAFLEPDGRERPH